MKKVFVVSLEVKMDRHASEKDLRAKVAALIKDHPDYSIRGVFWFLDFGRAADGHA